MDRKSVVCLLQYCLSAQQHRSKVQFLFSHAVRVMVILYLLLSGDNGSGAIVRTRLYFACNVKITVTQNVGNVVGWSKIQIWRISKEPDHQNGQDLNRFSVSPSQLAVTSSIDTEENKKI
jgi:hypothetical protein